MTSLNADMGRDRYDWLSPVLKRIIVPWTPVPLNSKGCMTFASQSAAELQEGLLQEQGKEIGPRIIEAKNGTCLRVLERE